MNFDFENPVKKVINHNVVASKYESKIFKIRRDQMKDRVIELYKEKGTFKQVAQIVGLYEKTVARIIKENNIPFKSRGYAAQKVLNNPFDKASFEDKSYWIGFIAGDGHILKVKHRISICSIDREIVDNFAEFVGDGINITEVLKLTQHNLFVAGFSHKEAKDYLINCGITTKKSLTLKFNVKLNWSIIRGLFDADGSFSQNRFKITTGSPQLASQLEEFFISENFKVTVSNKDKANRVKDVFVLGGRSKVKEIYDKVYHNETNYFLKRKKEQIGRYLSKGKYENPVN